jgi:hypothetical protein
MKGQPFGRGSESHGHRPGSVIPAESHFLSVSNSKAHPLTCQAMRPQCN